MAWLMLGVTVVGCGIFTVYGAGLFFRFKSREFGIFLALGERRGQLKKQLAKELSAVIVKYVALGMVLAVPVSYLIWKLFFVFAVRTGEIHYRIGGTGVAAGLLFAGVLVLCILVAGSGFVKRTNIIDILNEQRKTELVKEIKPWIGKLGISLMAAGLILAVLVPSLVARLFLYLLPSVWNVTYLLCAVGLYFFMLSAVGNTKRGKNSEKYYKNIISTNLMRFTARQTTRNLCVIALLVFVTLFTAFFGVMYYKSVSSGSNTAPYDYSLHYPMEEEQITRSDVEELAQKHQVKIASYKEAEALELIIHYISRDLDDNGTYFDVEAEKLASFLSASDFERISGTKVELRQGRYKTVVTSGYHRTIWVGPDCVLQVEHPVTGETKEVTFDGTVECDNLTEMSSPSVFVLSDEDYAA